MSFSRKSFESGIAFRYKTHRIPLVYQPVDGSNILGIIRAKEQGASGISGDICVERITKAGVHVIDWTLNIPIRGFLHFKDLYPMPKNHFLKHCRLCAQSFRN